MHKHYIRIQDGKIVKGFSDAFESPTKDDILIAEDAGRHFELFDQINPPLTNERGIALYKHSKGKVVERTKVEIDADIANIPEPEPSEMEQLKAKVEAMEAALVSKEVLTKQEIETVKQVR